MAKFGQKSESLLAHLDEGLVAVNRKAIEVIDYSIIYTFRGQKLQDELFAKKVSKLKFPNSKHNSYPAKAFDFGPYPILWPQEDELRKGIAENDSVLIRKYMKATSRFYLVGGVILDAANSLGVSIRWGADWDGDGDIMDQTFDDLGHIELRY